MIDTQLFRTKILSLALRGNLTKQISSYSDAKVLADEIRKKNGNINVVEKIENIPYEIPSNWCWMRVSEFGILSSGKPYEELPSGVLYVKVGDMNLPGNEKTITTSQHYVSNSNSGIIKVNSIIFPKRGGAIATNKKRSVLDSPIFIDLNTMALTVNYAQIFPFVKLWFDSLDLAELQTGTSIPQINNKDIYPLIMPLPPLEEQKRIVDIVEKAFDILDKIDIIQEQYSANLEVLKAKIIDAGIQGKLTEQLPEDGTAEELLKQIRNKKDWMINDGLIPKESASKKINDEDMIFDIPQNWAYARVQDVATYITDYVANGSFATLKANTITYKEPNYAVFVRTLDLGAKFQNELSYIDEASYEFLKKSKLYGGELILPNIGASIGKAFIMPDLGMPMSLAPNSVMVKFENDVMNKYFYYVFQSSYGKGILMNIQGGAATPKFSKTDLRKMIVMLPPLAEQERIVNRIEEIFTLIQ